MHVSLPRTVLANPRSSLMSVNLRSGWCHAPYGERTGGGYGQVMTQLAHPDKQEQRVPPAPLQDCCGGTTMTVRHPTDADAAVVAQNLQAFILLTHGDRERVEPGALARRDVYVLRQEGTHYHVLCGAAQLEVSRGAEW